MEEYFQLRDFGFVEDRMLGELHYTEADCEYADSWFN